MMKNAIILSARKEKDSEIPYPLLRYNDKENLLDRTISILREYGIEHITIVTGYKYEMFESYRSKDVDIIMNPDYEFTGSMSSLAACENIVDDDFLLIESDTFFEKEIISGLQSVTSGNCLAITEESGSGDECYVETKNGFITKISKDIHRVRRFEGELIGISRISIETYRKMVGEWKTCSNPLMNYEYVFMDVTDAIDRRSLFFKNLIWGDVDCNEDFLRLKKTIYRALQKKENPYDEENLKIHLHNIFPNKDITRVNIEQIGGMSNKNFRIDWENESYVLRVPGNGAEEMVERNNEEFNAIEASRMGINPEINYFNPKTGIKLAKYINGAETLNAATVQRHDNMRQIAQIYKTLHGSHIRLKNEFNIFHEILKYKRLIRNVEAQMYSGWKNVESQVLGLEFYLNSLGVDLKPCHNDGLYENFIKDLNGKIYLIDWEYSGMNDPMADFAALFLEADFKKENEEYILNIYFENNIPQNTRIKILCYQILWDYLWAQWTVIKEKKGDEFGSYGQDRFNRAKNNLNLLKQYINNEKE